MRILVTIPHFFQPQPGVAHSSASAPAVLRARALATAVAALRHLFSPRQFVLDHFRRTAVPANQNNAHQLEVVVCTTRGQHVLNELPLPAGQVMHHATDAEPTLLGYECHAVLRDALGRYDWFCYLEDDLIVTDPQLFAKLAWFSRHTDPLALLQPNRYEVALSAPAADKLYLDGDLRPGVTAPFQDVADRPEVTLPYLDAPVRFTRTLNPHAGCFFLSAAQMAHWAGQPHFLDRAADFIGPLESAATLGIMRAFRVYKPALEHADFLQIRHGDEKHLRMVGPVPPAAP